MTKLTRANLWIAGVKVPGLQIQMNNVFIPVVRQTSKIPLMNRPSTLSDLSDAYLTLDNHVLPIPYIPIAHDEGFSIIKPKYEKDSERFVDSLSTSNGKFVVEVLDKIVHGITVPKRISTKGNICTDSYGKKYNFKEASHKAGNLVEASAGIMVIAHPFPSHLLRQAQEYCSLLVTQGTIKDGYIYTDQGLEEYA